MVALLENYRVVSIIGMGKNVGKTTVLNYLLKQPFTNKTIAITSIGFDGEDIDSITQTPKPKITINPNTLFATTGYGLTHSTMKYELLEQTNHETALGPILIGKCLTAGNILLCGPSTKTQTIEIIQRFFHFGASNVFIDGAFSKSMLANPLVADAIVLSTGAAISSNIDTIVEETMHRVRLYDSIHCIKDPNISYTHYFDSVIGREKAIANQMNPGDIVCIAGAISDRLMQAMLLRDHKLSNVEVVVDNPTSIFVTKEWYDKALKRHIHIKVKQTTPIIAITINPTSPNKTSVDTVELKKRLQQVTSILVVDVVHDEMK